MTKRVVVTGLGAVTPLGQGVPEFWRRLIAGERGLGKIRRFDPTGLRNELGGEIGDWRFAPDEFGLEGEPDPATQFLLTATREALADAGIGRGTSPRPTVGAVLSTNFGGGTSWEEWCGVLRGQPPALPPSAVAPGTDPFAEFSFHAAIGRLRSAFGLEGPLSLLSIACASGAASIGYALDLIRAGEAPVMLAGGHDALAPTPLSGLSTLHTITAEDIRPFSADRSGTLFGEGAAVLVLEDLEHAVARGARIYAEVLGAWQNNNAYHLTAPDPGGAGMARVLGEALYDAEIAPEKLDYINAHGTGTAPHDAAETEAIKAVLGNHAYEIPVSSIKGAIAHLMGAAGAIEAVATVKAIETGVVPPTVNYRERDPACDLDVVPNEAREALVRYAATMSAGVGGSNACVVFGPVPDDPVLVQQDDAPRAPGTGAPTRDSRGWKPLVRQDDGCELRPRRGTSPRPTVVITGLAPISAIGIGREDFAAGLREGREGRRPPERLTAGHTLPLLAECLDFVVEDYLESEKTYLDRCSELALAACALAWDDAGLDWRALDHERSGLCLGTGYGCLESMQNMTDRVQTKGLRFGSPVIFTHSFANSPTSLAAIEYDLQGPTSTFCVGDVSAGSAFEYAWRLIRDGRAEVMLAGGVEALSVPLLADQHGDRHLTDHNVDGNPGADRSVRCLSPFVPGEGACLFVLESLEHAERRGAVPLAEIVGCTLLEGAEQPEEEACGPPKQYGHTFGASMALDVAAALLADGGTDGADSPYPQPHLSIGRCDPTGCCAAIYLRRVT